MRTLIPFDRSNPAELAAVSLVTIAAVALFGLVLAYWTWIWLAPRPEPHALPVEERKLRLEPAYHLFGGTSRAAVPTGLAIELLGVVAESGSEPGYAVLRLDAKRAVAVREGHDIEPGVRLAEVRPDHVVLERGGARETLAFPQKKTTK
jgi:general secretion pathway protein C